MKKEISKSRNNNDVVKSNKKSLKHPKKQEEKVCAKSVFKRGFGLSICIAICIIILISLFIFIILGVVKYFNNRLDIKNKEIIEEYTSENKKVCFKEECFYVLDYSIEDRYVYLISEKNISLEEKSIQIDDSRGLARKDIDKYLGYYKKTLEEVGVEVSDISIPIKEQLEKNGCCFENNTSNVYMCSEEKKWIYSTSYYYEGDISGVLVNIDSLDSHFIFPFDMSDEELDNTYGKNKTLKVGIRVVIKVPISEIT